MTKNEIAQAIKDSEVDVKPEIIEATIKQMKSNEISKSQAMKELYSMGFYINDIAKLLDVRYNFVYNVISENYDEVRTRKQNNKDSKSQMIRELTQQGLSPREIGEHFASKGIYVNSNMIYTVSRKTKKQAAAKQKQTQ